MDEAVVDAVVEEMIVGGAGAAVTLAQPLVEAAVYRPVGKVRSEMPLAEHPGAVAVRAKGVSHGQFVRAEMVSPAMVCHTLT